jgi:hypothetical protein
MCTVLLPPGVNPIAVKYIISYIYIISHIIYIYIISYITYHISHIIYISYHISHIIYISYHISHIIYIYHIIYHIYIYHIIYRILYWVHVNSNVCMACHEQQFVHDNVHLKYCILDGQAFRFNEFMKRIFARNSDTVLLIFLISCSLYQICTSSC